MHGRPRRKWLNHIQDADARPLSTIWRSEVARGHGGAAERNGPLGLRDDDDDDEYCINIIGVVMYLTLSSWVIVKAIKESGKIINTNGWPAKYLLKEK